MITSPQENAGAHHVIHYTVDGEPQTTTERELTPRQIIKNAGLNPDERYLVEIRGREQVSYKDNPGTPIHLHEHEKFVTVFIGPVPVS